MDESTSPESPVPGSLSRQGERLFQQHFGNSDTPQREAIARLVEPLLLQNAELEKKVADLTTLVHQLEKYRDRYVDLYDLAPVGYATLDEEGYIQEINLAGAELLRQAREELIGYPLDGHVVPTCRDEFLRQVRKCCCQREVVTDDVEFIAQDGTMIMAHLRGVPVEFLESEATFCKLAITDITERCLAETALKASEANYRAVFNTANDAIFVHDAESGAILDANQKATEMYGYTTQEFRQLAVDALSEGQSPYSFDEALARLQRAIAGIPQRFDWKARNKAGEVFWVGVNLKRTMLNGLPRLLAVVRDITERKQSEEALRESEERFRMLAHYAYDWEYWRGSDGALRYVSPSCQRITGYAPEEFLADPTLLERIVHPDDRKELSRHFRRESPCPGTHTAEYRIVSRRGEERWIEHVCQPVYSVDQQWLGQRATNWDVTDRKRTELALQRRIQELEDQLSHPPRPMNH